MMESHIHLTLYPEYVELVHWFSGVILPWVLFLWYKCGTYSRAIDSAMGIIHKDSEGENIPNIRGKPTHLPFF